MNTWTVLVSPTVVQRYSTVFQSRLEKHRTETFSRHWWSSGYGMRSHPTENLTTSKNNQTIVYIFTYIFTYIHIFIFITIEFLTKPLRVLEDKVNKTNKQTNIGSCFHNYLVKLRVHGNSNATSYAICIIDLVNYGRI